MKVKKVLKALDHSSLRLIGCAEQDDRYTSSMGWFHHGVLGNLLARNILTRKFPNHI